MGTFAIQLGKGLGAHIATTASARGEELARTLGADIVVDYTREHFEQGLRDYDERLISSVATPSGGYFRHPATKKPDLLRELTIFLMESTGSHHSG